MHSSFWDDEDVRARLAGDKRDADQSCLWRELNFADLLNGQQGPALSNSRLTIGSLNEQILN